MFFFLIDIVYYIKNFLYYFMDEEDKGCVNVIKFVFIKIKESFFEYVD